MYDTAATLLAAGLDPERCIFFRQGDVPEHTELCWLLSGVTAFGELNRMTQFKEKSGAQRELVSAGLFIYPVLQAADVLAYRAHEVPGGRGPAPARRADARRRRSASTPASARRWSYRRSGCRRSVRGSWTSSSPIARCRPPAAASRAPCWCSTSPRRFAKKIRSSVTDSGSEVARGPDKAGITNLIEILAAVRAVDPAAIEQEFDGQGYGAFKQAVADEVIAYLAADPRALRRAARRRGRARGDPCRGRREGPRDRRLTPWPTSARRWGWERSGSAANVCAVALVDLELDLDVFAGPFDLLLTLILREEVDLLEVDLADVVITYIDHLERRGELDLEAATEFLVLIAALLELKSRLLLPGEEIEEIDLDPGEAAEELLARLLAAHRYRAAAAHLRERLRGRGGLPLSPRAAAASLAQGVARRRRAPSTTRRCWPRRSATCWRFRRRSICATSTVPKVTVAERLAHLRALLARGSFTFSEAVARSDRVTVAVTLYALLELYKQGEATWTQEQPFAEITIESAARAAEGDRVSSTDGAAAHARGTAVPQLGSGLRRRRWPRPPAPSCTRS